MVSLEDSYEELLKGLVRIFAMLRIYSWFLVVDFTPRTSYKELFIASLALRPQNSQESQALEKDY